MLDEISNTVHACEEHARKRTVQGVNAINQLGILHVGDKFVVNNIKAEAMFRRKRDALTRQVDIGVEIFDFFDLTSLWERQEKVASTSMAVTVAGMVGGRLVGGGGWMDGALSFVRVLGFKNVRTMIIPSIITGGKSHIHSVKHSFIHP